jgi:hypothetical protein
VASRDLNRIVFLPLECVFTGIGNKSLYSQYTHTTTTCCYNNNMLVVFIRTNSEISHSIQLTLRAPPIYKDLIALIPANEKGELRAQTESYNYWEGLLSLNSRFSIFVQLTARAFVFTTLSPLLSCNFCNVHICCNNPPFIPFPNIDTQIRQSNITPTRIS